MRLPLVGGAYKGRSVDASPEDCINLYADVAGERGSLVNVPGCVEFAQLPGTEVRGMHHMGGDVYAVCSSKLYKVKANGSYTDLGAIGTSSGIVKMADNGVSRGRQIAIADGGPLKVYNLDTGVITNTGSANTSNVAFLDGYFIFNEVGTEKFWWTSTYDGTTIDPLDFTQEGSSADRLISLFTDRKQLWLLGEETTGVWYNSGAAPPWTSFQGGLSQFGCAAKHSVARLGNTIAWLSRNEQGHAVPVRAEGYTPMSLVSSHPQVGYQMSQYTTISDAFAYTYIYEGHGFYVLTFPTENVTWVYDASVDHWHQRAHIINSTFPNRERYNCHCLAFEKHLVGDYNNGKIYELNSSYHDMDGTIIPNQRTTTWNKDQEEDRIRIRSLQLSGEEGVGGTVYLSYSKNGGHTWSSDIETSFGVIGDYNHRAIWRKLGHGREWVFRIIRKANAKTVYTDLIAKEYGET